MLMLMLILMLMLMFGSCELMKERREKGEGSFKWWEECGDGNGDWRKGQPTISDWQEHPVGEMTTSCIYAGCMKHVAIPIAHGTLLRPLHTIRCDLQIPF